MAYPIELTDPQWALVGHLFEPPGRRGAPCQIPRRQMVNAMLFLARTGCQWRYLPDRYGPWGAVWQQWRRWRANGVWDRAMALLAREIRLKHGREATPSMLMIDAQTVRGGRAGPTFHEAGGRGGRTMGTKRTVVAEILGLPIAVAAESARPHDVRSGRLLLRDLLKDRPQSLPRLQAIVADRGYGGLQNFITIRNGLTLDIKRKAPGTVGFKPIGPLWRIEHVFAQLGRWRRLARCYEGSEASARAWLAVASVGYMLART